MRNPFSDLFETVVPDSTGGRIYYKIFEMFVAVFTIQLAWEWALYVPRLTEVVLPLGLAVYFDMAFVQNAVVANGLALALTVGVLVGVFQVRTVGRYGYAVSFLLLLILYAARFSQGEIPHSANLFGMALLAVALGVLFFKNILDKLRNEVPGILLQWYLQSVRNCNRCVISDDVSRPKRPRGIIGLIRFCCINLDVRRQVRQGQAGARNHPATANRGHDHIQILNVLD